MFLASKTFQGCFFLQKYFKIRSIAPLNPRPPALVASASSAGGTMAIDSAEKCSRRNILGKGRHGRRGKGDHGGDWVGERRALKPVKVGLFLSCYMCYFIALILWLLFALWCLRVISHWCRLVERLVRHWHRPSWEWEKRCDCKWSNGLSIHIKTDDALHHLFLSHLDSVSNSIWYKYEEPEITLLNSCCYISICVSTPACYRYLLKSVLEMKITGNKVRGAPYRPSQVTIFLKPHRLENTFFQPSM